jgi:hypothetical protein
MLALKARRCGVRRERDQWAQPASLSTIASEFSGPGPVFAGRRVRKSSGMDFTLSVVLVLLVLLPAVLVGGLFVWAALKDGQEDRALQARLGIRRRTRLGR